MCAKVTGGTEATAARRQEGEEEEALQGHRGGGGGGGGGRQRCSKHVLLWWSCDSSWTAGPDTFFQPNWTLCVALMNKYFFHYLPVSMRLFSSSSCLQRSFDTLYVKWVILHIIQTKSRGKKIQHFINTWIKIKTNIWMPKWNEIIFWKINKIPRIQVWLKLQAE